MLKKMSVLILTVWASGWAFAGGGQAAPGSSGGGASQPAPSAETERIGSSLIGKLEGPEFILDPAQFPGSFNEAPAFAAEVRAGRIPELSKRLPEASELLVVKPLHEVGKYGGNWRRAFTGPADHENGNRINASDKPLTFDYTGTEIMPCLAKGWEVTDGGKTIILHLRKGARWSDGQPFTADDFVFWYEDIYLNKDIVPVPFFEFQINGKDGKTRKIDDFTVAFDFPEPYAFFVYQLAGATSVGGGFALRGAAQNWGGLYAPAHYLKQFLPKYSSEAAVNQKARAEGYDSWISYLRMKYSWALNPELPMMTPWVTQTPINTPTWTLVRNPYFWGVDTAGNQLPYIDRITMTLAENAEVVNLRGIAGDFDMQARHMHLTKLPVFLENAARGNYAVHLDPAFHGSDATIYFGLAYTGDPEIAKWMRAKDFRNALSMGINRDQLNEAFWVGTGTPGSTTPAPGTLYNPGTQYNTLWAQFDPARANRMLDALGLDKKDGEGYRLRSDGRGRLRLEIVTVGGNFIPYTQIAEMIGQQWKQIGIQLDVRELERNLAFTRDQSNENQLFMWTNDGTEMLLLYPKPILPVDTTESHFGGGVAQWYASGGKTGVRPSEPVLVSVLDRFRASYGLEGEAQVNEVKKIRKAIADQQWTIGTVGQSAAFMGVRLAKNNMGNIPERQANAQHARTPFSSQPSTFYFKN
jgi:peptide/nickel transport system substrate-binding protein